MRHFFSLVVLSFSLCIQTGLAQQLEYKPGSGLTVESVEEQWKFRLLGYVQSTFTYHTVQEENSVDNEFFVRRARLDFILDLHEKYQWFIELDGRGSRTELVLAQFDIRYHQKHTIRVGKFITPFSPENNRSSRALTTVERYNALNSMFLLPSLDTQYGLMFTGDIQQFRYFLSVTNGNGSAAANLRENNNAKDLQFRLEYTGSRGISLGISTNYAEEPGQVLGLFDHAFNPLNLVPVAGKRLGYLVDVEYTKNDLFLRTEYFRYAFLDDISADLALDGFAGGYSEAGFFFSGNTDNGLQIIARYELADYFKNTAGIAGPARLHSVILGSNLYMDGLFRLQTNIVYEITDTPVSNKFGRWSGKSNGLLLLMMAQVKF